MVLGGIERPLDHLRETVRPLFKHVGSDPDVVHQAHLLGSEAAHAHAWRPVVRRERNEVRHAAVQVHAPPEGARHPPVHVERDMAARHEGAHQIVPGRELANQLSLRRPQPERPERPPALHRTHGDKRPPPTPLVGIVGKRLLQKLLQHDPQPTPRPVLPTILHQLLAQRRHRVHRQPAVHARGDERAGRRPGQLGSRRQIARLLEASTHADIEGKEEAPGTESKSNRLVLCWRLSRPCVVRGGKPSGRRARGGGGGPRASVAKAKAPRARGQHVLLTRRSNRRTYVVAVDATGLGSLRDV